MCVCVCRYALSVELIVVLVMKFLTANTIFRLNNFMILLMSSEIPPHIHILCAGITYYTF